MKNLDTQVWNTCGYVCLSRDDEKTNRRKAKLFFRHP